MCGAFIAKIEDIKSKIQNQESKMVEATGGSKLRKLFQDSICVNIPMEVTADLGVAIKRTRAKRIKEIYENFPALKKEEPLEDQENKEELDSEDDEENKEKTNEEKAQAPPKKKSKPDSHVPQKQHYGNVIDYLEAKYVRGVMLQDDQDAAAGDGDDNQEDHDEKGSVYDSESSFLDDSLLKRDVAEQVLSQATHTKLELEQDDDDFFVNVGALEVEDHGMMDYDPLEDDKAKNTKRKRSSSLDTKSSKKSKSSTKKAASTGEKTKGKKDQQKKSVTKKPASKGKGKEKVQVTQEMKEQIEALKKRANDLKKNADHVFQKTRDSIKKMSDKDLPRKKKNEKVSIVVPDGKKPGDDITFSNPHVPGQKLRVKVPKNSAPGSKFVVSVPVPVKANPDVDHNKWTREGQDLLDEFSHAYDDWCHAESAWREMDPNTTKKFQLHHERMNKFDKLLAVFPKDLLTPIDGTYLRKIVRRARQNKHKRNKTNQKLETEGSVPDAPSSTSISTAPVKPEPATSQEKQKLELSVPGKGTVFPRVPAPLDL